MTEHDAQIAFYALLVGTMAFLAWLSRDVVTQKLALIMVGIWAASNVALAAVGYNGEPLLVPTMDAVAAILTAVVGYRSKSRVATVVFGLFIVLGVVHVVAFAAHGTTSWYYYLLKNGVFMAQAVLIGGTGVRGVMVNRLHRVHPRLRHYRARR